MSYDKNAYNKIIEILDTNKINYKVHNHENVLNVEDAKIKLSFDYTKGFKTIAFCSDSGYVFVVINALDKLNYKKLSEFLNISRSKIKMADLEELDKKYGYKAGGISPIPVSSEIKVVFDSKVHNFEAVYCGIGVANKSLEIGSNDLIRISNGMVQDIIT